MVAKLVHTARVKCIKNHVNDMQLHRTIPLKPGSVDSCPYSI